MQSFHPSPPAKLEGNSNAILDIPEEANSSSRRSSGNSDISYESTLPPSVISSDDSFTVSFDTSSAASTRDECDKTRQTRCCCGHLWSVTSLTVGLFVVSTVLVAFVFWSIGYFITRIGLSSLAVDHQAEHLRSVRDNFASMLADPPVTVNALEHVFISEEGQNGTQFYNLRLDGADPVLGNIERHRIVLFRLAKFHPGAHLLYLGLETREFIVTGQIINSETLELGNYLHGYAWNGTSYNVFLREEDGTPSTPTFSFPYDPKIRPWYILGSTLDVGNISWTPTFLGLGPVPALSMVLVKPFYDPRMGSERIGVLGCHMYLDGFNQYLSGHFSDEVVFAVDKDGHLLASSVGLVGKQVGEDVWEKITPMEHSSSVVSETAALLNAEFPLSASQVVGWKTTVSTLSMTDSTTSTRYLVSVLEFTDRYGLDVFIVMARPRSLIYAEADLARYLSVGLGSGVAVVSLILSFFFACLLATPLRQVSRTMEKISQLEFPKVRTSKKNCCGCGVTNTLQLYEFGKMNESMDSMSRGLDICPVPSP